MSESLLSPFLSFRYLYFCLFVSFSSSKFVSALLESFGAFLGVKGQNVQGWDGMDFSSQSIVPGFVPFTNDGILSSSQITPRIKLLEGPYAKCDKRLSDLGKGPATKSVEFLEKIQTAYDPAPSFLENYKAIFL